MKNFIIFLCLLGSLNVMADDKLEFSKYSKSLHLTSIKDNMDAYFSGAIQVTGKLHVDFYGPDSADNGAFFLPDEASLAKLPSVISRYHNKPAKQIYVGNESRVLIKAVGRQRAKEILLGKQKFFESRAVATINHFKKLVECDNRVYEATIISIKLIPDRKITASGFDGGC